MPVPRVHLAEPSAPLHARFARLRAELGVPEAFPPEVEAAAAAAAGRGPRTDGADATDVPFVTVDPPGSRDLDQAFHLERRGEGYRLRYAIADVGAFVRPGDVVDAEARRRGETLYSPDLHTSLYPTVLSEGAASLLPGERRAAVLWTLDLDATGELAATGVRRAVVESREQLTYADVQDAIDAERAPEPIALLRVVGELRLAAERRRGGVSLPVPAQAVVPDGDGFAIAYDAPLPSEGWNAQLSLATGLAAARLMLDGRVGLLRTLPPADPRALAEVRRAAAALGVAWPEGTSYADFIRDLDPGQPAHAALLTLATRVLRGAGYRAVDGQVPPPDEAVHAAIAAPYAHVTAPLRRLADRYAQETAVALAARVPVDPAIRAGLAEMPSLMGRASRLAGSLERAVIDLVEATVLAPRVGDAFDVAVLSVDEDGEGGTIQLERPAVRAACRGRGLRLGERMRAVLTMADPVRRRVEFAVAS